MESGIGYADLLRMIIALVFVLSLIFGILVLIKRYGKNWGWNFNNFAGTSRRLEIKESLPVGPKQRIMIIRRDNQEHVLAIDSEKISVLEKNIPSDFQHRETLARSANSPKKTQFKVNEEDFQ
ncbi:MAG: flagellar biosynthetic protein FliO [Alphaproteobacteria bacterium]|nr:flagellar biosynthetic protein FliO [Alphaproteobacteria bacterium]